MLKSQIKVGGLYTARVSGKFVTVRVEKITETEGRPARNVLASPNGTGLGSYQAKAIKSVTYYLVTNLDTGRTTTFRSAAKFRKEVKNHDGLTDQQRKFVSKGPQHVDNGNRPTDVATHLGDEYGPAVETTREERDELMAAELAADKSKTSEGDNSSDPTKEKDTSSASNADTARTTTLDSLTPPAVQELEAITHAAVLASSVIGISCADIADNRLTASTNLKEAKISVPTLAEGTTKLSTTRLNAANATPSPVGAITSRFASQIAAIPAKPIAGNAPTEEQVSIINCADRLGKGDVMVIEAGAGAGKTTTLTMIEQTLKGVGQYTAFNSSLVAESGRKFKNAACNTTHSLAFRAVGNRYAHRLGGARVRAEEIARVLGVASMTIEMIDTYGEPMKKVLGGDKLTGMVMRAIRKFCQSADMEIRTNHFGYIDGIDLPVNGVRTYANNEKVKEYLLPFAVAAWKDIADTQGTLPFTHDYYVKIWQLNNPVIAADYILLDEAQDTAPVMLDVLKQQKALVILVGDSAQQIYEWRGAVNAMSEFANAETQYLSQSFRFGVAIADVANTILSMVGTPLRLKGLPSIASRVSAERIDNPTAILCRTNAVAVGRLLQAIEAGKKPFLVGGGAEVIAFVEAARNLQQGRGTSHPELACFSTWTEVEMYSELDEGQDLKLMVKLIKTFGCDAIINALKSMPQEKDADLVICTAHKSKGREWHSVRLATDFPTADKCDPSDLKLLYVAVTRAKMVLDLSECPFFTGEDAPQIIASSSTTPPPPIKQVAVTGYQWTRNGDKWCVRGPKGNSGKVVSVVKKDGSTRSVRLGPVRSETSEAAVYAV